MLVSETSEEMKVEKWHVFKISSNDCKSFCKQRNHNATLTQFLFTFRLSNSHFYIPILAYISICWYHIVCYLHIYISLYFHMLSIEIQSFTFFLGCASHRGVYDSTLGGFEGIFTDGTYGYLYGGGTSGGFGGCGILIWLWKWGNCNIKHIIIGYNRDIAGICWDTLGIHNGYNWIYSQQFSDHKIMANMMIKCQTWNLEVPYL